MYIDAAQYLQDIRAARISIRNYRRLLKQLEYSIGVSAITYEGDRISSSPPKDGLERDAIKYAEEKGKLEEKISETIIFMNTRMDEAVGYINQIESEEQQEVLMMRYIEGMKWSEILDERECDSISAQHRLHNRAIESLQKVMQGYSMGSI